MINLTPHEKTTYEYIMDWFNGDLFPWYKNEEAWELIKEANLKYADKKVVITTTAQADRWLLDLSLIHI